MPVYLSEDGYSIKGIEPPDLKDRPEFALWFWQVVTDLGLKAKDKELAAGLNVKGKPLRRISAATRKHRKSAMTPTGKGDPSAPPLMPGRQLSRTRSLLAGRAYPDHASWFWRFDPWTGQSWYEVLKIQRDDWGRDVIGLSPKAQASVKTRSWAMWADLKAGRPIPALPTRQAVPMGIPQVGRAPTAAAEFGIGGAPRGTFTGGLTWKEWQAYFRQPARVVIPSRPGEDYNVILRHIWGAPGKPLAGPVVVKPPKPRPIPIPRPKPPKPAPPTPPTSPPPPKSGPMGPAIGMALVNTAKGKTAVEVKAALDAIDKIHGDGSLPRIPIKQTTSHGRQGSFVMNGMTFGPVEIRVSGKATHPRMTTAHEVGHFIEHAGIPKTTGGMRNFALGPEFQDWLKVVKASQAWKDMRLLLASPKTNFDVRKPDGTILSYQMDRKFVRYLLQDNELWARSYAQYIATKSKDAAFRIELEDSRKMELGPYANSQWSDEDFQPIADAIDTMFTKLGWIR